MKPSKEMIEAAQCAMECDPKECDDCVERALQAVLNIIDPVPDDINVIVDSDGDGWSRSDIDPLVWTLDDAIRTYAHINKWYGPMTWEGKDA